MNTSTFSIVCPHCGNPVMVTVEENSSGGKGVFCNKCSHALSVSYSYCGGDLHIFNVL